VRADEGYIYRLCGCGWREEDNLPDGLSVVLGSREIWGPGCSGKSETRKQRLGIGLVELSMGCRYWSRTLTPLTFMLSSPYILWGLNCIDGWMALMMADCSPFPHALRNLTQISIRSQHPLPRLASNDQPVAILLFFFVGVFVTPLMLRFVSPPRFSAFNTTTLPNNSLRAKGYGGSAFHSVTRTSHYFVFLLSVWIFFLTWSTVNRKRSPRKIPRFLILLFYPLFTLVPEQLVLKWL